MKLVVHTARRNWGAAWGRGGGQGRRRAHWLGNGKAWGVGGAARAEVDPTLKEGRWRGGAGRTPHCHR